MLCFLTPVHKDVQLDLSDNRKVCNSRSDLIDLNLAGLLPFFKGILQTDIKIYILCLTYAFA